PAILSRIGRAHDGQPMFRIGLDRWLLPLNPINFVTENGLRAHMYNDMEVGSYLTWDGWPRYRVFQDPRINGYPPDFHALLRRDRIARPEWDALMDRFGVTSALVTYPAQNPRITFFDPEHW